MRQHRPGPTATLALAAALVGCATEGGRFADSIGEGSPADYNGPDWTNAKAPDGEVADLGPDGGPYDDTVAPDATTAVDIAGPEAFADTEIATPPTAVASVSPGEIVNPNSTIYLKSEGSWAPSCGASPLEYLWNVKAPGGTAVTLVPGVNFPNPMATLSDTGAYEFCLQVWDCHGTPSQVACVPLLVLPKSAVHIELRWTTPGDPDQSDSGPGLAADLDLHFAHDKAQDAGSDFDCDGKPDPYFDNPHDAFWFNANPNWDDPANFADDPMLEFDDGAAGPESVRLDEPPGTIAGPRSYTVGVHSWNDYGFGPSAATINVYIYGVLAVQITGMTLQPYEMWTVGKLNWPNKLTEKAAFNFEPFEICYQSSDPCKGGKRWVAQGDHCITPKYPKLGSL